MNATTANTERKMQGARTKKPGRNRLPPQGVQPFESVTDATERNAGAKQEQEIEIALLDLNPRDRDKPLDEATVESHMATINASGMIVPITVVPKAEGRYEIETGRHRVEARRRLGLTKVRAIVQTDTDPAQIALRRHIENHSRRVVQPYEQAIEIEEMLGAKLTLEDIARARNQTVDFLKARLALRALPEDIGHRIGQPDFPVAHAEVLLQLVGKDEKLMQAARKTIGRLDFDKRPLTLRGFEEAVEKELRRARLVKDPETRGVQELVDAYPELQKRLDKLPSIKGAPKWGSKATKLCIDPKAFHQTLAPYKQKFKEAKAEAAAKESQKPDPEERWREQQRRHEFVRAYGNHEIRQRIAKAARGSLGIEDRLLGLLAQNAVDAMRSRSDPDHDGPLLADAVGMPLADLSPVLYGRAKDQAHQKQKFVERLVGTPDRLPLARFLTVATLLRIAEEGGGSWPLVAEAWLGLKDMELERGADKAYKAWVKAGAKDPLPGQPPAENEDSADGDSDASSDSAAVQATSGPAEEAAESPA